MHHFDVTGHNHLNDDSVFVCYLLVIIKPGSSPILWYGTMKYTHLLTMHILSYSLLSMQFKVCPQQQCRSTPGFRTDLFRRDYRKVLVTDFFGSVRNVELSYTKMELTEDGGKEGRNEEEGENDVERDRRKGDDVRLSYAQQFPAYIEQVK